MPRSIPLLTLVLALLVAGAAQAQDDPVLASRTAYAAAVHAYQGHDLTAFLAHAREAQRLRPDHGGVTYALASACALSGDTAGALAMLRRLAVLGYASDVAADSDFATLRTMPAFDAIRRSLRRNGEPLVRSRTAFTLAERDLLTEGIAYDPRSRSFFVGSVHRGTILRVDREGRASEFVPTGTGGMRAPLGMRVDAARGVLWVAAAALPQMAGFDSTEAGRSGLFRFDLSTGQPTGRFPVPDDGRPHTLGDVTVSRAGDVYATDSRGPGLYRVAAGADSLEQFLSSPLLLSAQGLALGREERTLYVADYARGLLQVDLASRTVRLVPAADGVLALGIDGLYAVGGDLLAIMNGVIPHRVVRLRLDPHGERIVATETLERAHPDYAEPTLGVVVDGSLYYIANSQWERFGEDGAIDAPDRLQSPVVLQLRF